MRLSKIFEIKVICLFVFIIVLMSGCESLDNFNQVSLEGKDEEGAVLENSKEVSAQNSLLQNDVEDSSVFLENEKIELPKYFTDCMVNTEKQRTVQTSYICERMTAGEYYYIDENNTLWRAGSKAFSQVGMDMISDDKNVNESWIADNVIHVDRSENGYYTIFITENHDLYGFGQNTYGVLRQEYIENEEYQLWLNQVEAPVLLMENVQFASAGRTSITVLTDNNEVYWWGRLQATTGSKEPGYMESWEPMLMLSDARYVVCSSSHAAAIDQKNGLWLWGCNVWGQCGQDNQEYIEEAVKVTDKVEMVWVAELSSRNVTYARNGDLLGGIIGKTSYPYSTFIRKNGGNYYACGINLGSDEKTVQYYGDLMYPENGVEMYTHNYSRDFIPIEVVEISEQHLELE